MEYVQTAPPERFEVCPKCQTKVLVCPGIGPYCPNDSCDVIDGLDIWDKPKIPNPFLEIIKADDPENLKRRIRDLERENARLKSEIADLIGYNP